MTFVSTGPLIGMATGVMQEYFTRLGVAKLPGVLGFAAEPGEVEQDRVRNDIADEPSMRRNAAIKYIEELNAEGVLPKRTSAGSLGYLDGSVDDQPSETKTRGPLGAICGASSGPN